MSEEIFMCCTIPNFVLSVLRLVNGLLQSPVKTIETVSIVTLTPGQVFCETLNALQVISLSHPSLVVAGWRFVAQRLLLIFTKFFGVPVHKETIARLLNSFCPGLVHLRAQYCHLLSHLCPDHLHFCPDHLILRRPVLDFCSKIKNAG